MATDKSTLSTAYAVLRREIDQGAIAPIYLFVGEETYLIDALVRQLKAKLIHPGAEVLDLYVRSSESPDPLPSFETLRAQLLTPPFLSQRRLFIFENTGWFGPQASKNQALLHFLESIPQDACLILKEAQVDRKQRTALQTLSKVGRMGDFPLQTAKELGAWLTGYAHHLGLELQPEAAQALIARCEQSMWRLSNELKKMALYMGAEGQQHIDLALVDQLGPPDWTGSIFDLLSALARGQATEALTLYDHLLHQGEPALRILFMVSRQIRHYLCARDLTSDQAVAQALKLSPYRARKVLEQACRLPESLLLRLHEACFQADHALKSGRMDEATALLWLLSLSLKPARPLPA